MLILSICLALACVAAVPCACLARGVIHYRASEAGAFITPVTPDALDPAAFAEWMDGAEHPMQLKDGPRHVLWTATSAPEWDGVHFGGSKRPGARHLRIGWKSSLTVGSVLVRCGGRLSALRAGAAYPGDMAKEADWIPAIRLKGRSLNSGEVEGEEYALWVFPPGAQTRALRFTHVAKTTDANYDGWLGGAFVLADRFANLGDQAVAATRTNPDFAGKINNDSNDGTWSAWDAERATTAPAISQSSPEWVMLVWPRAVTLRGLNALWAGFGATEAQAYTGPTNLPPREAKENEWHSIRTFSDITNQYPRALGVNWMDFGQEITTRAIRLRITSVTTEGHSHITGKTMAGRRIWLGELLALQPLKNAALTSAAMPLEPSLAATHPPIPIRFHIPAAAFVTLVIEDASGKRVRNLISDTHFPAGDNVGWWDGTDDLARDVESAAHGIYHVPGSFVQPGMYRVRGLAHGPIGLHYEFSVYNSGSPAWETADHTGAWLANHTPPSSALFVPADRSITGKPLVYLGSYVTEGGHGLAWVDLNGRKQGGVGWVGGAWTGAPYLARDTGPGKDTTVYVGSAWEGDLRLTAVTAGGDKPIIKYTFPGGKEEGVITGLAVRNGLLACSLPKRNTLLLVDVAAGKILGEAKLTDGRGLAFTADGSLLALSGKEVVRYDALDREHLAFPRAPRTLINAGLDDPQAIALDSAGNLYGTTVNGGGVYKLSAAGQFTLLYAFTGGVDGGVPATASW